MVATVDQFRLEVAADRGRPRAARAIGSASYNTRVTMGSMWGCAADRTTIFVGRRVDLVGGRGCAADCSGAAGSSMGTVVVVVWDGSEAKPEEPEEAMVTLLPPSRSRSGDTLTSRARRRLERPPLPLAASCTPAAASPRTRLSRPNAPASPGRPISLPRAPAAASRPPCARDRRRLRPLELPCPPSRSSSSPNGIRTRHGSHVGTGGVGIPRPSNGKNLCTCLYGSKHTSGNLMEQITSAWVGHLGRGKPPNRGNQGILQQLAQVSYLGQYSN
ncbi:hypothetical protein BRADI_2g35282v3 [Brachypodium distachyon]|uniref:Uncharacterized protein n=1 Tax=Brachypodium distachyon TaxID=15368 RepID=A0A0Q3G7T2_BRADI|nr:hypothetical protein BRADI_2g35282v3 [Brachypodium distachyon]